MKIVWDEPKRIANLDKHGMDFADINEKFFDTALVLNAYGKRYRAIGMNVRGVISVIFAVYGVEAVSIISMRPASKRERDLYEANRR
ncbi:BrnT family toxin [Bradyrhizobium roseum]|uniref:BrnT family toxin n=1 Tax=Bradyrhizobium roseum TaxID=3056648 RepID=UPI002628FE85|nr:BrnT family toxin [Bradyrhizobium roseus]WKA26846.1 BrnT family toxin [Bradyrhizobium roseus]